MIREQNVSHASLARRLTSTVIVATVDSLLLSGSLTPFRYPGRTRRRYQTPCNSDPESTRPSGWKHTSGTGLSCMVRPYEKSSARDWVGLSSPKVSTRIGVSGFRRGPRGRPGVLPRELWNGDGDFQHDPMWRGSLCVPTMTASIVGGVQPDKLQPSGGGMCRPRRSGRPATPVSVTCVAGSDRKVGAVADRWANKNARATVYAIYAIYEGWTN
jgi:hypothetical protein